MEAERRSTMSSLKGQLSNVEGSVKSMKAAVVVGSVLTVACLAAVFGVTILANEVSKEVKVSNGVVTSKAGNTVVTASSVITENVQGEVATVAVEGLTFAANVVVNNGASTFILGDDVVFAVTNTGSELAITEGTMLAEFYNGAAAPARNMSGVKDAWNWVKRKVNVFTAAGYRVGKDMMNAALDYVFGPVEETK
jgi:hypothetical protein